MKKISFLTIPFIFFAYLVVSCDKNSIDDINHLNGYWEIDVVRAHGEEFVPKKPAPLVDYYQVVESNKGWKKKMAPQVMGEYQSSDAVVYFTLEQEGSQWLIHYRDNLSSWKEEIIILNDNTLVLFQEEKYYHYKRHQKQTLNER